MAAHLAILPDADLESTVTISGLTDRDLHVGNRRPWHGDRRVYKFQFSTERLSPRELQQRLQEVRVQFELRKVTREGKTISCWYDVWGSPQSFRARSNFCLSAEGLRSRPRLTVSGNLSRAKLFRGGRCHERLFPGLEMPSQRLEFVDAELLGLAEEGPLLLGDMKLQRVAELSDLEDEVRRRRVETFDVGDEASHLGVLTPRLRDESTQRGETWIEQLLFDLSVDLERDGDRGHKLTTPLVVGRPNELFDQRADPGVVPPENVGGLHDLNIRSYAYTSGRPPDR